MDQHLYRMCVFQKCPTVALKLQYLLPCDCCCPAFTASMGQTQHWAASASHHVSPDWIFCCSRGPEVCVHLKWDSWLQFVHPSVMRPLSWKVTEEVNWLLYLQWQGCWSSAGMPHALGGETYSHFVRICWCYPNRPPSAIVIGGRSSDKMRRVYLMYSSLTGCIWEEVGGPWTKGND